MRVAFDGRSLAHAVPRGMDRYLVGLGQALETRGVEVSLLHRADAPPADVHLAAFRPRLVPVPGDGLAWEQRHLGRALRDVDLYHAPCEHGVPLWAPVPAVLTIHSLTVHSYERLIATGALPGRLADYLDTGRGSRHPSWRTLYWYLQVARARHILVPSAFTRDEVVDFLHVAAGRVSVTPLAPAAMFDTAPLAAEPARALAARYGLDPPLLLFVGGFERHKNIPGLLEVYRRLAPDHPGLSLALVGTTEPPGWLTAEAARLSAAGHRTVVLSNVGGDLPYLYDLASVFVTLSWRESFCLPLLEALTRGTPVVASAWGAGPSVAGEHAAARFVDPRDTAAGAAATHALLTAGRDDTVRAAARQAAARFTWAECATRTHAVYERVLGG